MSKISKDPILEVIDIIVEQFMDQQKKDNFIFANQHLDIQYNQMLEMNAQNFQEERNLYIERIQKSLERDKTTFDTYNMCLLEDLHSHPIRQAESRYLQKKHYLSAGKTEVESWAIIGMHLASLEEDSPVNTLKRLSGKPVSNRGRPKTPKSIDYTIAVWLLFVNAYKSEKEANQVLAGETIEVTGYSSTQIIKAYQYAFENSKSHDYLWVFEKLDGLLKLRHKSLNSLLTSFHRGERERVIAWRQFDLPEALK